MRVSPSRVMKHSRWEHRGARDVLPSTRQELATAPGLVLRLNRSVNRSINLINLLTYHCVARNVPSLAPGLDLLFNS